MSPRTWICFILCGAVLAHTGCSLPLLNRQAHSKNAGGPRRMLDDDPATYGMQIAKGRNHESAGQLDKAREVYGKLIADHPQRAEAYHRLGIVADRQRRHTEAQELFTQALRLDGQNAQLLNDLGYCFFLQGKLSKAESALNKAAHLDPKAARFRNNLGMVIGHQDRHAEALAEFRKAGSDADAFYNLAYVYASQDRADMAKQCFRQALAIDPRHEASKQALSSFQKFDEMTLADRKTETPDDGYYVPHREPSRTVQADYDETGERSIAPASYADVSDNSASLSQMRRSMHDRAKKLLDRNMATQRNESP